MIGFGTYSCSFCCILVLLGIRYCPFSVCVCVRVCIYRYVYVRICVYVCVCVYTLASLVRVFVCTHSLRSCVYVCSVLPIYHMHILPGHHETNFGLTDIGSFLGVKTSFRKCGGCYFNKNPLEFLSGTNTAISECHKLLKTEPVHSKSMALCLLHHLNSNKDLIRCNSTCMGIAEAAQKELGLYHGGQCAKVAKGCIASIESATSHKFGHTVQAAHKIIACKEAIPVSMLLVDRRKNLAHFL